MANFCETRFAKYELMAYYNFEKDYNTYRMTWSGDSEGMEPEAYASTLAAKRES